MRQEYKIALGGLGVPAIGAILWGVRGLNLAPPHWTYAAAIVVGGAGAVVSACVWLHIAFSWLSESAIGNRSKRPPLEIAFDPLNTGRKFWSLEVAKDENGNPTPHSYWEYRAAIKNVSHKTVRNVRVTVEATGAMPLRPEPSYFDINKKHLIDLHPGEETLAIIRRWWNPIRSPGVVLGPDAYGPIKMTVGAEDVPAVTKLFQIDAERDPIIYEMPASPDLRWKQ